MKQRRHELRAPSPAVITRLLRDAWRLRLDQALEECRHLVGQLCQYAGWSGSGLGVALESPVPVSVVLSASQTVELLALIASIARAENRLVDARQLLAKARQWSTEQALPPIFSLHFQEGLNAFGEGDFSVAMECFIAARAASQSLFDRACAATNLLFCLDNLGLPVDRSLGEIVKIVAMLPDSDSRFAIESQIDCFKMHRGFRNGALSALTRPRVVGTQSWYFQLWVSELPFTRLHGRFSSQIRDLATLPSHLWQKSYRFRTLQGVPHRDDFSGFSDKELSDRVYLWMWRWLAAPQQMPLRQIMLLLEQSSANNQWVWLNAKGYQMIRNALAWLGLFHPHHARAFQGWSEQSKPAKMADYPLFAFEQDLITYLHARRQGDETEASHLSASLRQQPLARRRGLLWNALLFPAPQSASGPLARVWEHVYGHRRTLSVPVKVDLGTFCVQTKRQQVISEPLARALALLCRNHCIPADVFLDRCFGIPHYDSLIHSAKIYNLLARIRPLLSRAGLNLRLGMKENQVFAEGDWTKIAVFDPGEEVDVPANTWSRARPPSRGQGRRRRIGETNQLVESLSPQKTFQRLDLERLSGLSKSSANRLLQSWQRRGWIRSEGKARNRKYRWLCAPSSSIQ